VDELILVGCSFQEHAVIPVLSVVGRSNSGKTTLLEKLIRELTRRGRRIGTIKHHFHGPVEVDIPGKDSWRHKRAGARTVALVSPETLFVLGDIEGKWTLESIAHQALFEVDLILTEGFKSGPMPKIEVNRAAQEMPLLCGPADNLVAVVTDRDLTLAVPRFGLDGVGELADFIEREFLKETKPSCVDVLVGGRRIALDGQTQEILARVVRSLVGDCRDLGGGPTIELRVRGQTP
jgi:molybdopterin-guanine dinucleotide biosynthesis protein B